MKDNGLHGLELRSRISGDSVQAIPSGRHQSRAKTCEGPFVSGRTSSASFKVIHSLRLPDRPSLWQDSWGFWGGPVDRLRLEKPENRSPTANSLRTC